MILATRTWDSNVSIAFFSAGLDKSMTAYNFSIIDPDGTSNFYQDFGR